MMNHVFSDIIDLSLLINMDDILIYVKTEEEHDKLVHQTLERLQKTGLQYPRKSASGKSRK